MGYAELFAYHVLPIVRARRTADGNYVPLTWAGTGFTFGQGTFVTCWHCVAAPLGQDEVYVAVGRSGGLSQSSRDACYELRDLARDRNGSDLALASIGMVLEPILELATDPLEWGDDVVAFGFPFTMDTGGTWGTLKNIQTRATVFKGYVTRLAREDHDHDMVVELMMPAPVGMSGGPLFRQQRGPADPFECVGVLFGERMSGLVSETDGELIPRSLVFGYAVRLDTLRNASGSATNGNALADHLTSGGSEAGSRQSPDGCLA